MATIWQQAEENQNRKEYVAKALCKQGEYR